MFSGKPTRIVTALVVCMQIMSSLFLSIAIPAPQSMARESQDRFALEVRDVLFEEGEAAEPEPMSDEEDVVEEGLATEAEVWSYDFWQPVDAVSTPVSGDAFAADELRSQGVIYDGEYRYTWYSQRVLPGGGLDIDGRHVSDEGYVVDAQERIVVASSDLARGTELDVPFGSGKAVVLDTGCASGTIDIYTDF